MSDGREEREDAERRRQEQKKKDREDWVDRGYEDPSAPERGGS